jgi:outer membrane protein assembly factor BamE
MKTFEALMPARAVGASLLAAVLALGCSSGGGLITPYRMDVLQGNVVTREQVQVLQVGMGREQVRNVLGTPLLASVFHAQRWDYVFTFQRQGQEPQQRRVSVFFKDDALERVEADALPSEAEFVASLDKRRRGEKVPVLEATPEQIKAFQAQGKTPAVVPMPAATTTAPSTSYPPLETR